MLRFNKNTVERKTLAYRLSLLSGHNAICSKETKFIFKIGPYTIDRNGDLYVAAENADEKILTSLMDEGLIKGGDIIEDLSKPDTDTPSSILNYDTDIPILNDSSIKIIISTEGYSALDLRNMIYFIYSKGELISKATGGRFGVNPKLIEVLSQSQCVYTIGNLLKAINNFEGKGLYGFSITKDNIIFYGFNPNTDTKELEIYRLFFTKIDIYVRNISVVRFKPLNIINEKNSLHSLMNTIDMIGSEYREARLIMLKKLKGQSGNKKPKGKKWIN